MKRTKSTIETELLQKGYMPHGVMDYDYTITPWFKNGMWKGKEIIITLCKHSYTDDEELIFKIKFTNRIQSNEFLDTIISFIDSNNKYGNDIAYNLNHILDHFANEFYKIYDNNNFAILESSFDGYKLKSINSNNQIHFKCAITGDEIYIDNKKVMRIYDNENDFTYDEPRQVAIDHKKFIFVKKDELNKFINALQKEYK